MAAIIKARNLTSGEGGTGVSSVSTASISPTANKLVFVSVGSKINGSTPNQPTVSGCGITWEVVTSIAKTDAQRMRHTLFRGASSTPSAGTLTIDFGGQNQERITWVVDELDGAVIGSNGADAIVQINSGQSAGGGTLTSTTLSLSLSTFASETNATYGTVSIIDGAITAGSGFTELAETDSSETNHQSQFKNSPDTSVDWSWASAYGIGIAVEVKAGQPFQGGMI